MWQIYAELFGLMVPLAVCLTIGYVWSHVGRFQMEFCTVLVIRISTPALVFHTLSTIALEGSDLMEIALLAWAALLLCAVMGAVCLYVFRLPVGGMLPAVTFPNTGNFGLPISYLALGEQGFAVAVVFFASCAVAQHTLSSLALQKRFSFIRLFTLPPLVAVILAVIGRLSPFDMPGPVLETTRLLGALTVPLMLLVLGNALANMPRTSLRIGSVLAALRLCLGLFAAWVIVTALDVTDEFGLVVMIQMAMPTAVISYVYARASGAQVSDPVAGAVLISTLVSLITIPILLWWLKS